MTNKPKIRYRRVWNGVDMEDEYQVIGPRTKILSRHNLDEIVRWAELWMQGKQSDEPLKFVDLVGRMTLRGEITDGEPFSPDLEDETEVLESLVIEARAILEKVK